MVGVGRRKEGRPSFDLALSMDATPPLGVKNAESLWSTGLLARSVLCNCKPLSPAVRSSPSGLVEVSDDNLAFLGLGESDSCLNNLGVGESKSEAVRKLASGSNEASSTSSNCARVRAPATAQGALRMVGGPPLDGLRSEFFSGDGDLAVLVLALGWNASGNDSRKNGGGLDVFAVPAKRSDAGSGDVD